MQDRQKNPQKATDSFLTFFHLLKTDYFPVQYVLIRVSAPSTPPSFPHSLSPSDPLLFCLSSEKSGVLRDNDRTRL